MTKWLILSLYKRFFTVLDGKSPVIATEPRVDGESNDRYELQLAGPNFDRIANNLVKATIIVNISVVSEGDAENPHKHATRIQDAVDVFANCIPVYKLGPLVTDDASNIGGMELNSSITVMHYGYDPVSLLNVSAVEAEYTFEG